MSRAGPSPRGVECAPDWGDVRVLHLGLWFMISQYRVRTTSHSAWLMGGVSGWNNQVCVCIYVGVWRWV